MSVLKEILVCKFAGCKHIAIHPFKNLLLVYNNNNNKNKLQPVNRWSEFDSLWKLCSSYL